MLTAARAVAPKTRKGRTATVRPLTKLNTSATADNATSLRVQRLGRDFGMFGPVAETVALLAWEVVHG